MDEVNDGDVMVVRGLIDHINLDNIRRELRRRLDNQGDVYVDVSEARPVGPSVLMVFVSAARLAGRRGKSIHLLNPSMSVRHLLARHRHLSLFVVHDEDDTSTAPAQGSHSRTLRLDDQAEASKDIPEVASS